MNFLSAVGGGISRIYQSTASLFSREETAPQKQLSPLERATRNLHNRAQNPHEAQIADYFSGHFERVGVKGELGYASVEDAAQGAMRRAWRYLNTHDDAVISPEFRRQLFGMFVNTERYTGVQKGVYARFKTAVLDRSVQEETIRDEPVPHALASPLFSLYHTLGDLGRSAMSTAAEAAAEGYLRMAEAADTISRPFKSIFNAGEAAVSPVPVRRRTLRDYLLLSGAVAVIAAGIAGPNTACKSTEADPNSDWPLDRAIHYLNNHKAIKVKEKSVIQWPVAEQSSAASNGEPVPPPRPSGPMPYSDVLNVQYYLQNLDTGLEGTLADWRPEVERWSPERREETRKAFEQMGYKIPETRGSQLVVYLVNRYGKRGALDVYTELHHEKVEAESRRPEAAYAAAQAHFDSMSDQERTDAYAALTRMREGIHVLPQDKTQVNDLEAHLGQDVTGALYEHLHAWNRAGEKAGFGAAAELTTVRTDVPLPEPTAPLALAGSPSLEERVADQIEAAIRTLDVTILDPVMDWRRDVSQWDTGTITHTRSAFEGLVVQDGKQRDNLDWVRGLVRDYSREGTIAINDYVHLLQTNPERARAMLGEYAKRGAPLPEPTVGQKLPVESWRSVVWGWDDATKLHTALAFDQGDAQYLLPLFEQFDEGQMRAVQEHLRVWQVVHTDAQETHEAARQPVDTASAPWAEEVQGWGDAKKLEAQRAIQHASQRKASWQTDEERKSELALVAGLSERFGFEHVQGSLFSHLSAFRENFISRN